MKSKDVGEDEEIVSEQEVSINDPAEIAQPAPIRAFDFNLLNPYMFPIDGPCSTRTSAFQFTEDRSCKEKSNETNIYSLPNTPKGFQVISPSNADTEEEQIPPCFPLMPLDLMNNYRRYLP